MIRHVWNDLKERRERMANIREIAEAAGVSITTVSGFSTATRMSKKKKRPKSSWDDWTARICKEYACRSFIQWLFKLDRCCAADHRPPLFGELLEGIAAEKAAKEGVHFRLSNKLSMEKEIFALEQLKQRQVDGLIFLFKSDVWWSAFGLAWDRSVHSVPGLKRTVIFKRSAYSAQRCFPVRTGFFDWKGEHKNRHWFGKEKWHEQPFSPRGIQGSFRPRSGSLTGKKGIRAVADDNRRAKAVLWMERDGGEADSCFYRQRQVTAGMFLEAQRHQVDIPEASPFLSCDNQPISEVLGISTIKINIKEMGKHAFRLLRKKNRR